ncbi:VOC family protein [Parapedobacter sp. 10938]|uniref:VOC family protein n=1 Tax=Parapedobacter flavus TaxID=3110225 RepID=UPI002DB7419D|nr:VOC family protein [Parapedobacter sp. 10938]MEC3879601.1 VOC family protein [Parapedobacter sp. 10938]
MKSKLIWANFSVKDAKRTAQFYTQLGFTPNGSLQNNPELASFFFADNQFVIHFFEKGTGIDKFFPSGSKTDEIIFTLSADKKEEVQEFEAKVRKAGGEIFEKLRRDESGYYGFAFADPDGHKFNVLLMDNM